MAYDEDLAYTHDQGFGEFAGGAAPFLLETLHQHGIGDGLVIDLGCGSGIWAMALDEAGYKVMGVDISPAMIDLCKQRIPNGSFYVQSYLKTDLPPCRTVTSLGECFNYLFDTDNALEQLISLFGRIYKALEPGGLFIFDVLEPGHQGRKPEQKFVKGQDWIVLVEKHENPISCNAKAMSSEGYKFNRWVSSVLL